MSKRNRASLLLLAGALTFGTVGVLASCGEDTQKVDDFIKIANLDELKATWRVGDKDRTVKLTVNGLTDAQIQTAIDNDELTLSSSDATVIFVAGNKIQAKKAGKATITIKYSGHTTTIEITVLEKDVIKCANLTEVLDKLFTKGADGSYTYNKSNKVYSVERVKILAEEKGGNIVFTDGTKVMHSFGIKMKSGETDLVVGDEVKLEAQVGDYYGALNFKSGTFTKLPDKKITAPAATELTDDNAKDFLKGIQDRAAKNNSGPVSPVEGAFPVLAKLSVKYTTKDYGIATYKGTEYKIKFKDNKVYADGDLKYGDVATVDAVILAWNSGLKYFNIIAREITTTHESNLPTKVTLTAPQGGKSFEVIDLKDHITLEPVDAEADYTLEVTEDKNNILNTLGTRIIAKGEGSVKVKAIPNGDTKLASEEVTITFAGKSDAGVYGATIENKTVTELDALEATAVKDHLFYVKAEVTNLGEENDEYGNITLKDVEGETKKEITTYGVGTSLLDYTLNDEGTEITRFANPKTYKDELKGKKFEKGDIVGFYVFLDTKTYTDKDNVKHTDKRYCTVFDKRYKNTLAFDEAFVKLDAEAKDKYTIGEQVKFELTKDALTNYGEVKFNDEVVTAGTDGKYTVTIKEGDNTLTVAATRKTPTEAQLTNMIAVENTSIFTGAETPVTFPNLGGDNKYYGKGSTQGATLTLLGSEWIHERIGLGADEKYDPNHVLIGQKHNSTGKHPYKQTHMANKTALPRALTSIDICYDINEDERLNVYVSDAAITLENFSSATKLTPTQIGRTTRYAVPEGKAPKFVMVIHDDKAYNVYFSHVAFNLAEAAK